MVRVENLWFKQFARPIRMSTFSGFPHVLPFSKMDLQKPKFLAIKAGSWQIPVTTTNDYDQSNFHEAF